MEKENERQHQETRALVKISSWDFWKSPQISDHNDYGRITRNTNILKKKQKSVESFFEICVIKERKVFFQSSDLESQVEDLQEWKKQVQSRLQTWDFWKSPGISDYTD